MSNQAPQLPQTSHSPCHHGPTPYPTPGPRSETFYHPRNSSSCPIVDTHPVPPGVPFKIPCPICHGAIERGEHHHHSERDIVWSSSSNLRAYWNPFIIFQVLRSSSSLSLGLYFQVPYGLETSPHHSPPFLPIPTPSFINSIIQNIQYSIARPDPRPEIARGLSQSTRGSHNSWNLAWHPHHPTPLEEEFIEFRWNTPSFLLQEPTPPPEICQLIAPHPTYPIKPLRLLQDYLKWDLDLDKDNLNLYKRLDLIRESWHADSLVGINLWTNDCPEYIYIPHISKFTLFFIWLICACHV